MARRRQPGVVRKLEVASAVVKATTSLLVQTGHMLRQLVTIAGWLVLLAATVRLLLNPPYALSPQQFLAHGAGAAAVLQGLVKAPTRWRKPNSVDAAETHKTEEPP